MAKQARVRTIYFLIAINIVLVLALIAGVVAVGHLESRLNSSEDRNYAGCERGNVMREAARFALMELGSSWRAAQPELQHQPCALIYPGGAP